MNRQTESKRSLSPTKGSFIAVLFLAAIVLMIGTVFSGLGPLEDVILADFNNPVPNGENLADLGELKCFTESGRPLEMVAAESGIKNKKFELSDIGIPGDEEFGLEGEFLEPIENGRVTTWFRITPSQRNSELRTGWYAPFDRGVDLIGLVFRANGRISVGGDTAFSPAYINGRTYLVGASFDLAGASLAYEVVVVDLSTSTTVGVWAGNTAQPVDSIGGVHWTKKRAFDGRFQLDDIVITHQREEE